MASVLFEDNHLLVVNKPAGLATMGVAAVQSSLIQQARDYIKRKYNKPGNVYLGIVSRLDAGASGAIVVARTSKAAARLTEQFRSADVEKTYWALVSPVPTQTSDFWVDHLRKDERQHKVIAVPQPTKGAQEARLRYTILARKPPYAWLQIELETGRKHQIRVQCASRSCPVVGDRKYGSPMPFPAGIALHSRQLSLIHPTRGERLQFLAPPPESWSEFAKKVGLELHY